MGSIPVRVIKIPRAFARGIFNLTRTGIEQHGPAQQSKQSAQWAVACNPYEESKEHGRPQAAKKSPVGSFLVPRVAAPSIRACLGWLAFLRIVSCAERIRVGEADNPKAVGSTPKSWRFPPVRREDLLTAF